MTDAISKDTLRKAVELLKAREAVALNNLRYLELDGCMEVAALAEGYADGLRKGLELVELVITGYATEDKLNRGILNYQRRLEYSKKAREQELEQRQARE